MSNYPPMQFPGVVEAFTDQRMPASIRQDLQRCFQEELDEIQNLARGFFLGESVLMDNFMPGQSVKQLNSFFTNSVFPNSFLPKVAIGETVYLDLSLCRKNHSLQAKVTKEIKKLPKYDLILKNVDPIAYDNLINGLTETIHVLLTLEDASRSIPRLRPYLNGYRLYLFSLQTLRFDSMDEIIQVSLLFHDLLPHFKTMRLHRLTKCVMRDIFDVSRSYYAELSMIHPVQFTEFGFDWVMELIGRLALRLPPKPKKQPKPKGEKPGPKPNLPLIKGVDPQKVLEAINGKEPEKEPEYRFSNKDENPAALQNPEIPPLENPRPPSLFNNPPSVRDDVKKSISNENGSQNQAPELDNATQKTLDNISQTLGQAREDSPGSRISADQLEQIIREEAFDPRGPGPYSGTPPDKHAVEILFPGINGKNEEKCSGNILECVAEPGNDERAFQDLLEKAQPIAQKLKKCLYPDQTRQIKDYAKFKQSGGLDPGRLALAGAGLSSAVFRKPEFQQQSNKNGKPVLLICQDQSGSLGRSEMGLAKTLMASWLLAAGKDQTHILAGSYSSKYPVNGSSRKDFVEWIFHPRKSLARTHKEAVKAVAGMPESGHGTNHDVICLEHMLKEARKLNRDKAIYMIILSDTAWNKSFEGSEKNATEEVHAFFEKSYREVENLHISLAVLHGLPFGSGKKLENLLDKVIYLPKLSKDPTAVTAQIGEYVAGVIQERRHGFSKKNKRKRKHV